MAGNRKVAASPSATKVASADTKPSSTVPKQKQPKPSGINPAFVSLGIHTLLMLFVPLGIFFISYGGYLDRHRQLYLLSVQRAANQGGLALVDTAINYKLKQMASDGWGALEAEAWPQTQMQALRRAKAVQLLSEQLGVAHLRAKRAALRRRDQHTRAVLVSSNHPLRSQAAVRRPAQDNVAAAMRGSEQVVKFVLSDESMGHEEVVKHLDATAQPKTAQSTAGRRRVAARRPVPNAPSAFSPMHATSTSDVADGSKAPLAPRITAPAGLGQASGIWTLVAGDDEEAAAADETMEEFVGGDAAEESADEEWV